MQHEETEQLFLTNELEALRNFRSSNGLALSVYLDLRSIYRKKNILGALNDLLRSHLDSLHISKEEEKQLQEDIELIGLYLKTKNKLMATGIIIFSCAQKLFWRAYPLSIPIDTHLHIGSELDLEPLLALLESHARDSAWQSVAV